MVKQEKYFIPNQVFPEIILKLLRGFTWKRDLEIKYSQLKTVGRTYTAIFQMINGENLYPMLHSYEASIKISFTKILTFYSFPVKTFKKDERSWFAHFARFVN